MTESNLLQGEVHVILCQASAGWSFAEMRKVGRTDDAERLLASGTVAVSLLSSLRPLSRVIAFPFQVAFAPLFVDYPKWILVAR